MGCDIHMFIEVNKRGKWVMSGERSSISRDYRLFSLLANVRNYNDRMKPLSEPRGVPDDASAGYKKEVKRYGVDGHSHSYFTVEEIRKHPWNDRKHTAKGWIPLGDFIKLKNRDDPNYRMPYLYDSDPSSIPGRKLVSKEEMESLARLGPLNNSSDDDKVMNTIFTYMEIEFSDADMCGEFVDMVNEVVENLKVSEKDIRLVFYFDN